MLVEPPIFSEPLEIIIHWQKYLKGSESHIRQSLQPRLWLEVLLMGILSYTDNQNDYNKSFPLKDKLSNKIMNVNLQNHIEFK